MSVDFKLSKRRWVLIAFFFLVLTPLGSQAKEESRFALGLGAGWLHDYPGAAQGRFRFIPFPVYRGTFFRMDRVSGVSGKVFSKSKLNFSWNFIFQFPTDSASIPVRKGMPDLDWALSLGPQVKYTFFQNKNHKFFFRFPVRFNTCTNFSNRTRSCGITFNPGFRYAMRYDNIGEILFRAEVFSHSSEYQQYFFEVNPRFATPERKSYHAKSGYLGAAYGVAHTLPLNGWELVSAFNLYDYSGAANEASPLFLHKTNFSVFFATTIDF